MSVGRQRKVAYRSALLASLKGGAEITCDICGKRIIHASDLKLTIFYRSQRVA